MAGFEFEPLGRRFARYRIAQADLDRQANLEAGANPSGRKSRAELNRLLPVEEERVRAAMRVLHLRYRNWTGVSRALGYHRVTVERMLNIRRTATPAFAMRIARLLGASLGDVRSGAWPKPGQCSMCGV